MPLPREQSNHRARQAVGFTADGRDEAIRENALYERQAEAATKIRRRDASQIAVAPWWRKLQLKLRMHREIRREMLRIEREVAPREGLYLQCGTTRELSQNTRLHRSRSARR